MPLVTQELVKVKKSIIHMEKTSLEAYIQGSTRKKNHYRHGKIKKIHCQHGKRKNKMIRNSKKVSKKSVASLANLNFILQLTH
jgi:hypothetical protein